MPSWPTPTTPTPSSLRAPAASSSDESDPARLEAGKHTRPPPSASARVSPSPRRSPSPGRLIPGRRPEDGAAPRAGCDSGSRDRARSPPTAARWSRRSRRSCAGSACGTRSPCGGSAALGISPSSRIRSPCDAVQAGHRREQRLGVGMVRRREHRFGVAQLHHPPEIQHADPVGQVAHDAEVVADEQVGHALLALQLVQQVEDRGLHRHVQRRGRLVAHHQIGVVRRTRERSRRAA